MFSDGAVFSGLFLALTSVPLFAAGHRLKASHFAWSQLMVGAMTSAAWLTQLAVSGHALPFEGTLLIAVVVGSLVAAGCPDWSSLAHTSFTAVIFTVASFLAYATYVLVEANLGPASLAFGIILLVLQGAVLLLLVAHTFEILDVVCRIRWRREFGAVAVPGYRPKVSLHVPTHNEPPELVIQTLNALARLDYENFEVLVIDNNTRDESLWRPLEAHCKELGPRFRFFHLLPWPGFKSGALNFALDQTDPGAAVVGIVDADYVVEPNYLGDLVGHFADPTVGFVQTPQDYRDATERGRFGRALYLSYRYFFSVSMASRNERNAIIFAGTMGLIRRDALEATGGWDEWCITEDAEVSFRLLKAGYQSVYIDTTYGRGLMPLDYAGLKKQRFRWAFGGMQLLRLHAPVVFTGRSGQLTLAQRYAYISGGLQWLNDPITFAFTVVLLIASTALIGGGSLFIQPLVGGSLLIPPLLIWFGIMRFLWALRLRCRCSWREAVDAFIVLLGLTWVVTLACVRGLLEREGVFLRTPKESDEPRLIDAVRVVWFEGFLTVVCFGVLAALVATHPSPMLSGRTVLVGMLAWQGALYASAARTSFWNYQAYQQAARRGVEDLAESWPGHAISMPEPRLARVIGVAVCAFTALYWIAVLLAPSTERVWRSDPLNAFLPARSLLPASDEALVGRQLVREADAAQRHDLGMAMALWDSHGVIRDHRFTPDVSEDDRIWRGAREIRRRYEQEFQLRRYRQLRHVNLAVMFDGDDEATIVNDLDAVIESAQQTAHVRLKETDQWTLRRRNGQWRIVQLDINRATGPGGAVGDGPLVAKGVHE